MFAFKLGLLRTLFCFYWNSEGHDQLLLMQPGVAVLSEQASGAQTRG